MTSVDRMTDVFRMPALGADMTEGRVTEWLVAEGDTVERGDLVAIIETDKADIEVEVFEPCTFDEFIVATGELVQVGEPIARITLAQGVRPTTIPVAASEASQASEASTPTPVATRPATVSTERDRPTRRVSPRARRIAAERGIDLTALDGIVTGDVVERMEPERAGGSEPTPKQPDRAANMRRAIAEVMERSWREIPHYHVTTTLDLTEVQRRLEADNAAREIAERVVVAAVTNVAIARAAKTVPGVNGWWRSDALAFDSSPGVDLGLIVSLRTGGVVVPTITDADRLDPTEMMERMRDLVERARRGRLREGDVRPASISVTNMGDLGAESVLGVIYPPQVTLVGVGTPAWRPAVVDGEVVPRLLAELTVTGDHRAHDGLVAARFARTVAGFLEELP